MFLSDIFGLFLAHEFGFGPFCDLKISDELVLVKNLSPKWFWRILLFHLNFGPFAIATVGIEHQEPAGGDLVPIFARFLKIFDLFILCSHLLRKCSRFDIIFSSTRFARAFLVYSIL